MSVDTKNLNIDPKNSLTGLTERHLSSVDNGENLIPAWYSVAAIYKAEILDQKKGSVYQRIVFLITAKNDEDAATVGANLAKTKEHEYLNADGAKVIWKLVKIEQIQQLIDQVFKDGVEVYWCFSNRPL